MRLIAPTVLALAPAVAATFPVAAQSNEELLKELRAPRDRVAELENRVQSAASAAPAAPAPGHWGMTPEQVRELNRVTIKAEALQDNFTDQGFKGLKISGLMLAPERGTGALFNDGSTAPTSRSSKSSAKMP